MPSPSILNVKDFGAIGDGCHDDTTAIQAALNALKRSDAVPSGECGTGGDTWAPWPVALHFPAGLYRITAPLKPPFAHYYRLFGDSGRGGSLQGAVPAGTIIRQDTDNQPIFLFERNDSHSFTIERLGFTWKNQQGAPPGQEGEEALPHGAVGLLFSYTPPFQPPPQQDHAGYFHVRITECWFHQGWRGIAFDTRTAGQGGPGIPISLWDSQIDHCGFYEMKGSAVRLANAPGLFIGMPSNALRSLFVANTEVANTEVMNTEEQVMMTEQGGGILDGLDLEGSFHAPTLYVSGRVSLRSIYFEHLEIQKPNYRVVYLAGADAITLDGLTVDGVLDAQGSYGSIIHCDAASLVLSGARGTRGTGPEGGIALPDGDAFLVTGAADAQVQLVGKPYFPNPASYQYKVHLWSEGLFGSSPGGNVVSKPVRAPVTLSSASVNPGAAATQTVNVPGAKPGDVVSLGAPPNLAAAVIFSGVAVADDTVQIRLFNPAAVAEDASGTWYVTVGDGPLAGGPQGG